MDSITQIVLGAAVGEAVAGRKIGNKAIIWGGIAGTIPDLDIIGNLFMSEINALAYHRGFSHSFLFAFIASPILAWSVSKLYANRNKLKDSADKMSYFHWLNLFFWSIVTHPILDAFTMYGTQLFLPFSDMRVSFNAISVADPIYTVPFAICLGIAAFLHRRNPKRRWVNYIGILWSCSYLLFTCYNKQKANSVFEDTLQQQGVEYSRYMTGPTILNNVLWYACADTGDTYTYGLYSFLDEDPTFKLETIPKNHTVLNAHPDDRILNILKWFTNGYYNVMTRRDGRLQINDLRYGTLRLGKPTEDDFVFRFPVDPDSNGYYILKEAGQGPPAERRNAKTFSELWGRIKGI